MEETKKGEIIIYKSTEGPSVQVEMDGETVWLNRAHMAELFGKDVRTIGRHINNIYKEKELNLEKTSLKKANVQKMSIGLNKRTVYYNLDMIISVGYRVNSKRGTQFRIWATERLRDYLVKGYAVNQERLEQIKRDHNAKLKELQQTAGLFHEVIESRRAEGYEKDLLNIITDYARTWSVLNQYDAETLEIDGVKKGAVKRLEHSYVQNVVEKFKARLVAKKQAGNLFGQEVGGKLQGVLGAIDQTYDGKELYQSVDEKAAHLLYFMIKDHPFTDGNKRIGSLLFMLYLVENNYLMSKSGERKLNDSALAALALLIAESKPEQKDSMVKLVVNLINKH